MAYKHNTDYCKSVELESKYNDFHSRKYIYSCRRQNDSYFDSASMS